MRLGHTRGRTRSGHPSLAQPTSGIGTTDLEKDEDDSQSLYEGKLNILRVISIVFPKRLFSWIYSISLFILVLLMLAFVSVTPIDVIVKTTDLPQWAPKIIIVFIMCILFLLLGLVIYFLRLFQKGLALSEIPSKSVYVPGKYDLPNHCYKVLEENLQRCVSDIKWKASPLYNEEVNHPGLSPPESIQRRNFNRSGKGALLPPNTYYEDVIRLVGLLLWMNHSSLSMAGEVPLNYSFRKITLFLSDIYLKKYDLERRDFPDIDELIGLYEKLRFGPDLIKEEELFNFMVEFRKLDGVFIKYLDNAALSYAKPLGSSIDNQKHQPKRPIMRPKFSSWGSSLSNLNEIEPSDYLERSNRYQRDDTSRRNRSISPTSFTTFARNSSVHSFNGSVRNKTNTDSGINKIPEGKYSSRSGLVSSSIIKNKLSFSSTSRFSRFQNESQRNLLSKEESGYATDSERGSDKNQMAH